MSKRTIKRTAYVVKTYVYAGSAKEALKLASMENPHEVYALAKTDKSVDYIDCYAFLETPEETEEVPDEYGYKNRKTA